MRILSDGESDHLNQINANENNQQLQYLYDCKCIQYINAQL